MAVYLNNHLIGINSNTIVEHNTNTAVTVEPLSVTSNGTYTAPNGKAYSPITVNTLPTFKPILMRPDAELIQTYSRDYKLVENDNVTIPEYSTSNKAVLATTNLSPTITLDYTTYNYYSIQRMLAIPEYNIETTGKGKIEYHFTSSLMEIMEMEANSYKALNGTTVYASRYIPVIQQNYYCSLYWSSATAIAPYFTSTYGIIIVPTAPTISSGVLTVKTPAINMRGHTTYFTSTYFDAITDIRLQYVIEIYRAPKNNLNINGWGSYANAHKILDCIQNNNLHLT